MALIGHDTAKISGTVHNKNGMPVVSFSTSKADDGRMNIKYQGGNEMTIDMVDLIVGFANRIAAHAGIPATCS